MAPAKRQDRQIGGLNLRQCPATTGLLCKGQVNGRLRSAQAEPQGQAEPPAGKTWVGRRDGKRITTAENVTRPPGRGQGPVPAGRGGGLQRGPQADPGLVVALAPG